MAYLLSSSHKEEVSFALARSMTRISRIRDAIANLSGYYHTTKTADLENRAAKDHGDDPSLSFYDTLLINDHVISTNLLM